MDVHGRRDPEVSHETLGPGDVDIGTGALRADRPELADALAEALGRRLRAFFATVGDAFPEHEPAKRKGEKAPLNERPALRGARDDGRMTLSQQSARLEARQRAAGAALRLRLAAEGRPGESEDAIARAWTSRRGKKRASKRGRNASK